ncbi:MAG TPA: polysaccharide biosynthesis protein, partial [Malonomonas sp.]
MKRNKSLRSFFIAVLQVLIIVSSLFFALSLRFDFGIPPLFLQRAYALLPAVLTIKLVIFWKLGLFRGWWRYASMSDLITIFKANLLASLGVVLYAVIVHRLELVPRSVLALDGIFCFLMMGGVRFLTRAFRENYFPMPLRQVDDRVRVLIVGAGDAGQMMIREIRQNAKLCIQVLGLIDDDPDKQGQRFQGISVLGRQEDLNRICRKFKIQEVIIAIPSATGSQIRSIVERCHSLDVKFKILPGVGDLIDGRVSIQQIRDIDLKDLLGRKPILLDQLQIRNYLQGKRVLVTGAGGSIGSEICRQVARFSPEKLILFENAETPLFMIEQELINIYPEQQIVPIIGDIRNPARVSVIFAE